MQTDDTKIPEPPDIPEPVTKRPRNGGAQKLYRFANGFGASVVQGPYTYGGPAGLWELGVIRWTGDDYSLTYTTPITDDVLGPLTDEEVTETLRRIMALDENGRDGGGPMTPDIPAEPAANEGCTACGRPIHRVHGMWLDDLGRGHCPAGAKQGVNSHQPATAPLGVCDLAEVFTSPADGPAYYEVKCQHGVFYGVQPGIAMQFGRRWHAALPQPPACELAAHAYAATPVAYVTCRHGRWNGHPEGQGPQALDEARAWHAGRDIPTTLAGTQGGVR